MHEVMLSIKRDTCAALVVSVVLASFSLPAEAQGMERHMKNPTL
jgi:hypothetical protein